MNGSSESGVAEFGGVFADVQEAIEWQPILGLLRAIRSAPAGPAKLAAIRVAAAFFLKKAYAVDPERLPAFHAFSVFVDLAETDERVRRLAAMLTEPAK